MDNCARLRQRTRETLERTEEVNELPIPPKLQAMHEELSTKIDEYFRAWWRENGVEEPGDYINAWALVANIGNLEQRSPAGYIVETGPDNMPPHAIKGLFNEGIDWVCEQQEGEDE